MSKTRKFLSFIFLALLTFVLVGCTLPVPGGNTSKVDRTKSEAETALETISSRITFTTEELEIAKDEINLTKTFASYPDATFTWTSSNEQVIKITEPADKDNYVGRVTRSTEEDVSVTLECIIAVPYTKLDDGTSSKNSVTKTVTFTFVVKMIEATDLVTIAEAKTGQKNDVVTVEGVVVAFLYKNEIKAEVTENGVTGVIINDGTSGIYVYSKNSELNFNIGDTVKVIGKLDNYYGSIQISGGDALSVTAADTAKEFPTYVSNKAMSEIVSDFKAEIDGNASQSNYPVNPVTTGTAYNAYVKIVKSTGKYTNIYFEDPYTGDRLKAYYKTGYEYVEGLTGSSMVEALSAYDGKYVNLPIIPYATDSSQDYCALLAKGTIEEAEAPSLGDADMVAQTATKLEQLAGTYKPGETVALITSDEATGAAIAWAASVEGVIDLTTGKIADSATTQTITLTATITKGSETATKEVEIKINRPVVNPAPEAGTYVYEVVTTESTLYALAEMSGNYLKTTTDKAAAATVVLTKVDGGYTIQLDGKYLRVVRSESNGKTFNNINLEGTASDVWTWNEEAGVMTYNVSGTECYIGTYKGSNGNIYSTFGASDISYITNDKASNLGVTNFITKFVEPSNTPACEHSWDEGIVTKEPTCEADGVKTFTCDKCQTTKDEKVDKLNHNYNAEGICENCGESKPAAHPAPEAGNYVLKMEQKGLGKTLYALDQMDGFYVASTDDINLAATVVLTKVEGGYIIKVGNKYLEFQISGTYKNIKLLEQSTGAVWTWNETYGIMTFDLDGEPYFVGTYSTNKTFSATGLFRITGNNEGALGTTQYAAYLVKTDDTPACEHSWDAGEVTTAPTCETAGVKTFTCSSCNGTKTEVIDALGHTEPNAEGKCDNCGKVLETTKPGTDENDTIKFDFVNGADISDWSSWENSYVEHKIVIDDVNITISKGNKQSSDQPINDRPVMVAGKKDGLDQYLTVDMGDTAITSVVFELKQWNTKTFDSITVEYWDGEAWVEAGKLETLSGECSVSATFSETTKVRLHITAPASQNRVQLGLTSVTVTKA